MLRMESEKATRFRAALKFGVGTAWGARGYSFQSFPCSSVPKRRPVEFSKT
jgi:hypothetical protein